MYCFMKLYALLALLLALTVAYDVEISVHEHVNTLPRPWLGFGQEMWHYLDILPEWQKPNILKTISALGPYNLRVGGITADWVTYDMQAPCKPTSPSSTLHRQQPSSLDNYQGFWPTYERNITRCQFQGLLDIVKATNASLIFDLSELHGRNCNYNGTVQCRGDWDSRNLFDFLTYVNENDVLKDVNFVGWELGNELTRSGHITMEENIQDGLKLYQIVKDVWTGSSTIPKVMGPSTDICDNTSYAYLHSMQADFAAFTYHSYPDRGDTNAPVDLLSPDWLRNGLLRHDLHANSSECIRQWNQGPRQAGMQLFLTETNSGYQGFAMPLFLNGFWYTTSLGQYAQTGVGMHARWSMFGSGAFSVVQQNGTGVPDYFVALGFQQLMGTRVYNTTTSDGKLLAYSHCNDEDQLTIIVVNPTDEPADITIHNAHGSYDVYFYTSTDPTVNSTRVDVNGVTMSVGDDGTPSSLPKKTVDSITMPGVAYGYIVTTQQHPACA